MKKSKLICILSTIMLCTPMLVFAENLSENMSEGVEELTEGYFSDEAENEVASTEKWDVKLSNETEIVNGQVFTKEDGSGVNDNISEEEIDEKLVSLKLQQYFDMADRYREANAGSFEDISNITSDVSKIEISGNNEVSPKNVRGYTLSAREVSEFIGVDSDWKSLGNAEENGLFYEPYFDLRFYFGGNYIDTWTVTTNYDVVTSSGDLWESYFGNYPEWFYKIEKRYGISQEEYVNRKEVGSYWENKKWVSSIEMLGFGLARSEEVDNNSVSESMTYETEYEDLLSEETFWGETEEEEENTSASSSFITMSDDTLLFFKENCDKFVIGDVVETSVLDDLNEVAFWSKNNSLVYLFYTDFKTAYTDEGYKLTGKELEEFLVRLQNDL